jgi:hypothetical protein
MRHYSHHRKSSCVAVVRCHQYQSKQKTLLALACVFTAVPGDVDVARYGNSDGGDELFGIRRAQTMSHEL